MSTKELTAPDRARKALAAVVTEKTLNDLATKYADLTVVKDRTDLFLAKFALGELRTTRVDIQRAGKSARDDANAFAKAVIAEEKRLVGIIGQEESRIKELRETYEAEIERQRAEKARIEAERVAGIRARIARFHDTVTAAANGPSEHLQKVIERLDAVTIGDEYQELAGEAMVAVAQARNRARELHAEAVAREQAEAERKAREAAEAEARRKEKEDMDRQREEQARVAAALKAQQEAIERARREAEAKVKAEQARIDADVRAQREAIEKDRREAEAKARAEQQKRERQAAAERAETERQRRELAELKDEIERQMRAKAEAKPQPATLEQEMADWEKKFNVPVAAVDALWVILSRHGFPEKETDNA